MKKIAIVVLATLMFACNNSPSSKSSKSDSSETKTDTSSQMHIKNPSMDSTSGMSEITEGTMGMRNGKMNIMTGGKWQLMSQPMTCTDQCQVLTNGQVIMKN